MGWREKTSDQKGRNFHRKNWEGGEQWVCVAGGGGGGGAVGYIEVCVAVVFCQSMVYARTHTHTHVHTHTEACTERGGGGSEI